MTSSARHFVLCCFVLASSFAHAQFGHRSAAPPAPVPQQLTGYLPTLAPAQQTQATQVKGGIRITVTPLPYHLAPMDTIMEQQVNPSFKEAFTPHQQGNVLVQRTHTATVRAVPNQLAFSVRVSNTMSRVFRFAGVAVQFQAAGKTLTTDASGYGELANAIIAPRSEQEFTIYGPALSAIPSPTQVGVFFFDVVTDMDDAGNIKAKQNYEWYFDYRTQASQETVNVIPPEKVWVPVVTPPHTVPLTSGAMQAPETGGAQAPAAGQPQ